MAWVFWKGRRGYLYERINGKPKLVAALGVLGVKEADTERKRWEINNDRGGYPSEEKSIECVWQEYEQYLRGRRREEITINDYKECLLGFISSIKQLKEVTRVNLDNWHDTLKTKSDERRAHKLRDMRAFCGWLTKKQKYFKENPFQIDVPKQRKDAGRDLSQEDTKRLFDSWPKPHYGTTKELLTLSKLFHLIVYCSGTRFSELYGYSDTYPGATYENLNRQEYYLLLKKTKGDPRQVALPPFIIDLIPNGTGPIFFKKISESAIRTHLKRAQINAGITGRLRPHDGRVTSASGWARSGVSLKMLMDQFGWLTAAMAAHYMKVATKERVAHAEKMTFGLQEQTI